MSSPPRKQFALYLTEEEHQRLRIEAAHARLSMTEYARGILVEGMERTRRERRERKARENNGPK